MANEHASGNVQLRGKRAVVALDFHHARIYAIDAPTHSSPEGVTANDPWNLDHNLYHRAGNPSGAYDIDLIDSDEFFKTVAIALKDADEVLLLSHGKGKSNAGHVFEAYLHKHYSDVAQKIVADVRVDIDDITNNQLLRLGELYFGKDEPERDYGDSRRGSRDAAVDSE